MSDDLIHPSACIDQHCKIGAGTRIWHFCHLMSGCRIGSRCSLGQNVLVASEVVVGDGVKIQNNVSLYTGVELEDDVFIGPSVVFTNVRTPRAFVKRNTPEQRARTLVKRGATIGANATVVCGVTIGTYAMVGAGTLINKDVPAHAIMVGNPARQSGWACICGAGLDETYTCPECARTAQLLQGQLKFSDK